MRLKKHPLPFAVLYLDIKQNYANTSVFETKHPSCVQCEKPAACYYCPSITTLFCSSVITARLSLLDPTYRPLAYKRGFCGVRDTRDNKAVDGCADVTCDAATTGDPPNDGPQCPHEGS